MKKIIDVNLYAYGDAANNPDCSKGPSILKKAIERTDFSLHCHWSILPQITHQKRQMAALEDVVILSETLAKLTRQSVLNHRFFITLGGDHSAAIGSWSGAANAVNNLGLIWFDAHMDSHTFETTPSGNIHGMPLAVLLGHGESALTQVMSKHPKLKPENVVLIGIRSYEPGEAQLLKKLGVTVFYMDDIKKIGLCAVLEKAVKIVTRNTDAFGVSIDLDGFDPMDAPGVGCREPNGVRADDFLAAFPIIIRQPQLIGVDIVEFNPVRDQDYKTEKLAVELMRVVLDLV